MNVIFIGFLAKKGYSFSIKEDFYDSIMNSVTVMYGQLKHSIYILLQTINVIYISNKYPRMNNVTDAYFWYCKLGHINKNRINRLAKEKILNINDYESLLTCESYLIEKMTKSPFIEKGEQASDVLGQYIVMYMDL